MYYKNEKDLIIEKLEELINRGGGLTRNDPEVDRLYRARQILKGECSQENRQWDSQQGTSQTNVVDISSPVVDEFAVVYNALLSLRTEKDIPKAVSGLIEVVIFLFKVVTALFTKEVAGNGNRT